MSWAHIRTLLAKDFNGDIKEEVIYIIRLIIFFPKYILIFNSNVVSSIIRYYA